MRLLSTTLETTTECAMLEATSRDTAPGSGSDAVRFGRCGGRGGTRQMYDTA